MAGSSAWRVNDAVVYERMRDAARTLTGLLLSRIGPGADDADEALGQVSALRRAVLEVGFFLPPDSQGS